MNALAQNVTKLSKDYEALKKKCRQQQAEIEELKAKLGCDPAYFDMPARKLTDEEIVDIGENTLPNEAIGFVPMWQWIEFAKAILRKAQEK